jgi:acyl-CoA synthetase (AMP-forming)/AMP-acid ligase II
MASFAEVVARSSKLASVLRARFQRGQRVLLVYPPGIEFVYAWFAAVSAGVVAVPAPPPHPSRLQRTLPRLASIAKNADTRVLLTARALKAALDGAGIRELEDYQILASDALEEEAADGAALDTVHAPNDVAMLQYTSGSTSEPKGVVLTHGSILHNLAYFADGWDHRPDSVVVNWLPTFHDLGLVYGMLAGVHGGFSTVLVPPVAVMQRPLVWLQAVHRFRGTHSTAPNFAYDLAVRKISAHERAKLDLSSWRVALNAAEPIRWETMERFCEAFGPSGFRRETFCAGYGLSETTCKVVAQRHDAAPRVLKLSHEAIEHDRVEETRDERHFAAIACGQPGLGTEVAIVDPETRARCAADRIGEIWVKSPSNARGYFGNAEETERIFQARTTDGDGPFMRTGDLGFMEGGDVFVTGRLKDLVIVRGENHYPQDIEYAAMDAHAAVRPGCCAAFSVAAEGGEIVVVVAEVERRTGVDRRLGRPGNAPVERRESTDRRQEPALPTHEVPDGVSFPEVSRAIRAAVSHRCELTAQHILLIEPGTLPKTSSGKVQRAICRKHFLDGSFEKVRLG